MSDESIWKMLSLLYFNGSLTDVQLKTVGIDCFNDTIMPAINGVLATSTHDATTGHATFSLTPPARELFQRYVISPRKAPVALRVDVPRAFVIMPFGQPWSDAVYGDLICPALMAAGCEWKRGDEVPRVGSLIDDVWKEILMAGFVVVDVAGGNGNVYYEFGLAHALGRPAFLLHQGDHSLMSDFQGSHYLQYDPVNPAAARDLLIDQVQKWKSEPDVMADEVGQLYR